MSSVTLMRRFTCVDGAGSADIPLLNRLPSRPQAGSGVKAPGEQKNLSAETRLEGDVAVGGCAWRRHRPPGLGSPGRASGLQTLADHDQAEFNHALSRSKGRAGRGRG
jgi:hypothetical protein